RLHHVLRALERRLRRLLVLGLGERLEPHRNLFEPAQVLDRLGVALLPLGRLLRVATGLLFGTARALGRALLLFGLARLLGDLAQLAILLGARRVFDLVLFAP